MTCVLDASITLSFLLADEFTDSSAQVLARVASDGAIVPTLWDYEVLNGVRSAERRGRINEADVRRALQGLARLPIERDRRPITGMDVIALARQFDLSIYDAAYLWLAIETNLPLASRDSTLLEAARQAGVSTIG